MISMASIAKHPVHPMLIPLPIGLWIFSLVCDIIMLSTGNPLWSILSLYTMAGGIIGALFAALPGLVDLFTLNPSFVKRLGIWHMGVNLIIVLLYVINFLWRREILTESAGPFILSLISVMLLGISGWLGGELVYVHGVAVEPVGRQRL
ncbi:DUF2231 domain-containing protein [Geobacter sp. DSM 9736]|uniref:DUF2231 domain-containing protein n=1 Tax=Geobacter sp. DSM 9736 TaxID=1277350 RepID=UPI000B505FC9|nr:DUF2231 domain-containing protein [Geobacter sp. DSM 9736]SNB46692.1 Uncharacterized membrane protein [Geobacter sp. DSM 9736]